jgi:ATP-dependent DNA helicase RecG
VRRCGRVSDDAVTRLERELHAGLSPKALVSVQVRKSRKARRCIVIEVPAGKDVPYAFRDVNLYPARRRRSRSRARRRETIRDIVMRRQIEPERWERRFSLGDLRNRMWM